MAGTAGRAVASLWRASRQEAAGAARSAGVDRSGLLRTIEREIIPRLVLAHRGMGLSPAGGECAVSADHVGELVHLVLDGDADAVIAFVRKLHRDGLGYESIYLDVVTPVARRLGDMWLSDECDFSGVTLGVWQLQRVLHECSAGFHAERAAAHSGGRILLAAMPGEQHTFGVSMLSEFFRRAGWQVTELPSVRAAELVAAVGRGSFDVVGLSLSSELKLDALGTLIRELRRAAGRGALGIMVGGPVFLDRPDAAIRVGADASARDARSAVALAQDLLGALGLPLRAASGC